MTDWTKKPGRRFSKMIIVACPRCYKPLPHPEAVCDSAGCTMHRERPQSAGFFGPFPVEK
jgi:hypothetical protein